MIHECDIKACVLFTEYFFFKREEIRTCSRYMNQKVDEGIQRLLLTSISLLISVFLFRFLHTCTVMMFSPKSVCGGGTPR